jgi:hypothetical protein
MCLLILKVFLLVLIKVLFEDKEFSDGICYWSTLDSKGSLMEIGLEESTGLIFEICVVISHTTYQQDLTIVHNDVSEKAGLPLFETDAWKQKVNPLGYHVEFYDPVYNVREKNHFEIYAGDKKYYYFILSRIRNKMCPYECI